MSRRFPIAVFLASLLNVSPLAAAGRPPVPHNAIAPHPSMPQPKMPQPNIPHPNHPHPQGSGGIPQLPMKNGAIQLHHLNMKGPQHLAAPVLRSQVLKGTSKVQQTLHHHEHGHQWHYRHGFPWVWGVYGYLPLSSANIVVGVPSGNSLNVSGLSQRVRLAGVGAPAIGQAFFAESKESLEALASGQHVRVFPVGTDFDGAMVAQVFLDSGTHLNEQQIRSGMSWNAGEDGFDPTLANAEQQAQMNGSGLWGGDYSWDY
jgi:endonuclease YncB( thermonuclease family)